jgi:hypothetical protein
MMTNRLGGVPPPPQRTLVWIVLGALAVVLPCGVAGGDRAAGTA